MSERRSYKKYCFDSSSPIPRQTRHNMSKRLRSEADKLQNSSKTPNPEADKNDEEVTNMDAAEGEDSDCQSMCEESDSDYADLEEVNYSADSETESEDEAFESYSTEQSSPAASKLYNTSQLSAKESQLLVFAFILRHKLTTAAADDLLSLIQLHLPSGCNFPTSSFKLRKRIGFDYSSATKHYYCPECEDKLAFEESEIGKCLKCESQVMRRDVDNTGKFFFTFNIRDIMLELLSDNVIAEDILRNMESAQHGDSDKISNFQDGQALKILKLDLNSLSCTLNTDGVPCFKSSKFALWPILFSINEMSYKLRRKHTLPIAIWFGDKKPKFSTFLDPFVKESVDLAKSGITWNSDSKKIVSKVYFTTVVADSVARCAVQGLKQFNGSYGCTWCLSKGENFAEGQSRKWIYPPESRQTISKRSHPDFVENLREFQELLKTDPNLKSHLGIKGASKFLLVPKFDIINGFVFDYMHTCLLGISRTFTNLWLDIPNHLELYYLGKHHRLIDERLSHCQVPFNIQRSIRSIQQRKFWKASEWRTWTYLIPIVLEGVLESIYLDHFRLYIKALCILNSESIGSVELGRAEAALFKFVKKIPALYGKKHCSYNSHLLLHATDCVRNWGPLYQYSAFQFENYNGVLLNFFNGTQKVSDQISARILESIFLPKLGKNVLTNLVSMDLFNSLVRYSSDKVKGVNNCENVTFLGPGKLYTLNVTEEMLIKSIVLNPEISVNTCTSYRKCIIDGTIFDTFDRASKKRCNSIVSFNGNIYIIRKLLLVQLQNIEYAGIAKVSKVKCKFTEKSNCYIVNRVELDEELIRISNIELSKFICIRNEQNDLLNIVKLPNIVELE